MIQRFNLYRRSVELFSFRATIIPLKVCRIVSALKLIRTGEGLFYYRMGSHPEHWISPTSVTRSNLYINLLFWKHRTRLDQSYNYASQSRWGSRCAWVDPGRRRVVADGSLNPFAGPNLRLFPSFVNRWSRLDRLYGSCHRKPLHTAMWFLDAVGFLMFL